MKALLKLAFAGAITYAVVKSIVERSRAAQGAGRQATDAANPPRSVDDIPTLRSVRDAEPQRPEPLRDEDLNIAQNAPF